MARLVDRPLDREPWTADSTRRFLAELTTLAADWETFDELADEWTEDQSEDENGATPAERARLTPAQLQELRQEMHQLNQFHALAKSIIKNSKGEVLLTALRRGFAAANAGSA